MDHEENKSIHSSIAYELSFLATVFCTDVVILMEPDTFPVSLKSDACSSSSSTKGAKQTSTLFLFGFFGARKLAVETNVGFILRIAANRMLFLRIRMSSVEVSQISPVEWRRRFINPDVSLARRRTLKWEKDRSSKKAFPLR
jgi:hypothetical protein